MQSYFFHDKEIEKLNLVDSRSWSELKFESDTSIIRQKNVISCPMIIDVIIFLFEVKHIAFWYLLVWL